jgi:hypothetical protein
VDAEKCSWPENDRLECGGKIGKRFFFNYCLRRKDFSIGGTGSCGSTAY